MTCPPFTDPPGGVVKPPVTISPDLTDLSCGSSLNSLRGAAQGPVVAPAEGAPVELPQQAIELEPSAVCAVTRAMTACLPGGGLTVDKVKEFFFAVPNDLCVSHVDLV